MAVQGGKLKCTPANGVKIYSIACEDQSLAPWLHSKKLKQKGVRKNTNYLELVQDLRFETATTKIKSSPDGEFLIASGVYPPQVKVYELWQHALKFERHLDSEIIDFEILGDDYSKLAFLCADRSVYLHAKYGKHYSLRIPRMGRDMKYDCWSCNLLCAASSPDLYRINLEQGRFLSSLSTQSPALNVVARSKLHGLVACGGEDGAVECFDMRTRSSIARINGVAPTGDSDQEVTAIEFDEDGGFLMAVGTSKGKVLLYDLRSSNPIRIKDHMYGGSIIDIKWHHSINSERPKLISTDTKIVNIWDPESVNVMTSIEPAGVAQGKINDICVFKDSGLMMLALDCSEITSHFLPALGPAPKWCSYLESLTEELEEDGKVNIYDGLIFLTMEDLEKLNATHLIGTNLLRAFAHGYFMDYRLYAKAKQMADPIKYESFIEQSKRQKIEEGRASRITVKKKLPKVNRHFAAQLLEAEKAEHDEQKEDIDVDGNETKKKSKKKKKGGLDPGVLKDPRFEEMFTDKAFEIDEESREYQSLHPMAPTKPFSLVDEHFEAVMEEDDDVLGSDASASEGDSDNDDDNRMKKKSHAPRLYEVKDERHAEAFFNSVSLAKENSLTMGERAAAALQQQQRSSSSGVSNDVKVGPGGSREVSFVSRSSAKYVEDSDDGGGPSREKRRAVQPLGLKPDKHRFDGGQGRGGGRGRGGGGRGRGRGGCGRGRGRR